VTKGQTQLEEALQAAFNAIIANGTYAAILKKWDLSGLAIKKSIINSAG
jgi:polar amino acid transport system substrate-binding protein